MYLKGHTNQFKTLLYSGYISFVQNEGCWRAAGNFLFLAARKFQSEELIWTHKNCAAARITRVRTPFVSKNKTASTRVEGGETFNKNLFLYIFDPCPPSMGFASHSIFHRRLVQSRIYWCCAYLGNRINAPHASQ
jgi:hypothetical protein